MHFKGTAAEVAETSGRLWRFADYEFDELGRELRVKGRRVDSNPNPWICCCNSFSTPARS